MVDRQAFLHVLGEVQRNQKPPWPAAGRRADKDQNPPWHSRPCRVDTVQVVVDHMRRQW